jgi:hypothetical protein
MGSITEALAIANKVLDRPHADPDDDLATMARGVVLMHEYATRPPARMVKAGDETINPAYVQSMRWQRTSYANAAGDSTLLITMVGGHLIRVKHEPQYTGGADAYAVEKAILGAG